MNWNRLLPLAVGSVAVSLVACAQTEAATPPAAPPPALSLSVDATDAARAVYHVHLSVPAHGGDLRLAFPKWIPGEHMPSGPLVNLVNLRTTAGGRVIPWRRDSESIYEIVLSVPAGASSVDLDYDVLSVAAASTPWGVSTSTQALTVKWNRVVLYPKGRAASAIRVDAHVKLPAGWSYATALTPASEHEGSVDFRTVSLETLVDSPLIAGKNFHRYDLGVVRGAPHSVAMVGDTPESVIVSDDLVAAWQRLPIEANALFGARHYGSYQFLVTASDAMHGGLEHHASSEDVVQETGLQDEDNRAVNAELLPHEYAHSWDGKHRRPRGIATPDFQEPMRDDLLWVYEGLTEYLGVVLTARSGLESIDDVKLKIASIAVSMDTPGRAWRPLVDTAIAAQILYAAPDMGGSVRRGAAYYDEGLLIWLEADVLIRQKTNGARSLDDFCQRFFGGKDGDPEVRPYDLAEVLKTLDAVAPNDWKSFFAARIDRIAPQVPNGGFVNAGYHVAYVAKKPERTAVRERVYKYTTYWASMGFYLGEGNEVGDVIPGSPAAKAGLAAGMKIEAVDGRKFSAERMTVALARAKASTEPIELLTVTGDFYQTVKIDWHQGERYPVLERDAAKPDLLELIFAPRVVKLPAAKPATGAVTADAK